MCSEGFEELDLLFLPLLAQIVKLRVLPHGAHDPHPCHPNLFEIPHEIPLVFEVVLAVSAAFCSYLFA